MKKWSKLLIAVLLVVCVISPIFTTASCEINDMYSPSDSDNSYWGEDMNDNGLLKMLAEFVYVLAGLAEHLVTNLFAMMSGTVDFPWADKIIFNSVAILDVNFISPAAGSYMASAQVYIQRIYYTMFTIALSLFGVLVLITAIKLAISTIASDKAKYKQALTSWILGFVMLWTIHFLMAFLFYLNEQLVIEASNMAKTALDRGNDVLTEYANEELKLAASLVRDGGFTSYITNEHISKARFQALYKKYEDAYVYFYITTQSSATYEVGLRGLIAGVPYTDALVDAFGLKLSDHIYSEVAGRKIIEDFTAILDYLDSKNAGQLNDAYTSLTNALENSFYVQPEGTFNNFAFGNKFVGYAPIPSSDIVTNIIDEADNSIIDGKIAGRVLFTTGYLYKNKDNDSKFSSVKFNKEYTSLHNINFVHMPEWSDIFTLGIDSWQDLLLKLTVPGATLKPGIFTKYKFNEKVIDLTEMGIADVDKLYATSIYGLPSGVNENVDMQKEYFIQLLPNDFAMKYYMAVVSHDDAKGVEYTSPACVIADLREIVKIVKEESSGLERRVSFIDNLAKYFKRFSHETVIANNKLVKGNPIIANQIMYAILVVQSIMLLIAYIKRLFYVLLLSMLAPLVVVMDFFQKFGK